MILRWLLTIAAAGLAFPAAQDARRSYWRRIAAFEAPAAMEDDPLVAIGIADRQLTENPKSGLNQPAIRALARRALLEEPIDSRSLRVFALAGLTTADAPVPAALRLSERVARRDLLTQLWLIESAANSGDIEATLHHYDIALTAYPDIVEKLAPVVAQASADPAIGAQLVRFAARPWYPPVVAKAIDIGAANATLLPLLAALKAKDSGHQFDVLFTARLGKLVAESKFADARETVRRFLGHDRDDAAGFGFSPASLDPRYVPLNWQLANGDGQDVTLEDSGALAIRMESESLSQVAERVTFLPPGDYDFELEAHGDGDQPSRLIWRADCLDGGRRELWQSTFAVTAARQAFQGRFGIASGCAVQRWRVSYGSGASQIGAYSWIDRLRLVKK